MPLALRADNTMSSPGLATVRVLDAGAIRLGSERAPLEHRLLALSELLVRLLAQLTPGELALEEAFFGKSVQSALRIGEARGVVLAESARQGLPVHQFAPARIKRCITGQGNAQKETVAAMVRQLLAGNALADLPPDATDALAVALCRAEQRRSPLLQVGRSTGRRFRVVPEGH
jgi:crossover junction endodeoxyribonuclease RuvC